MYVGQQLTVFDWPSWHMVSTLSGVNCKTSKHSLQWARSMHNIISKLSCSSQSGHYCHISFTVIKLTQAYQYKTNNTSNS